MAVVLPGHAGVELLEGAVVAARRVVEHRVVEVRELLPPRRQLLDVHNGLPLARVAHARPASAEPESLEVALQLARRVVHLGATSKVAKNTDSSNTVLKINRH